MTSKYNILRLVFREIRTPKSHQNSQILIQASQPKRRFKTPNPFGVLPVLLGDTGLGSEHNWRYNLGVFTRSMSHREITCQGFGWKNALPCQPWVNMLNYYGPKLRYKCMFINDIWILIVEIRRVIRG